jgi:hypothetical protein
MYSYMKRSALARFNSFIEPELYNFTTQLLARSGFFISPNGLTCAFNELCLTCTEIINGSVSRPLRHHCVDHYDHTVAVTLPHPDGSCFFPNREAHRILSFKLKQWPHKRLRAEDLAAAGFYFTGDDDGARCAFCSLHVSEWDAQYDTALGEHRRWNPACPFIRGKLVGNVTVREERNCWDGDAFHTADLPLRMLFTNKCIFRK